MLYDRMEVAVNCDEAYGFKEGTPGFGLEKDPRPLRRLADTPLLGVSYDVSSQVQLTAC